MENYSNEAIFKNAGLSELFADAFQLTRFYGAKSEEFSQRLHFAQRFFPQTIAYAVKLLNENGANLH